MDDSHFMKGMKLLLMVYQKDTKKELIKETNQNHFPINNQKLSHGKEKTLTFLDS